MFGYLTCVSSVSVYGWDNYYYDKLSSNPGGLLQPPLLFFSGRSKTLQKVTKGIKVISFTSFAVIFMKKKWRYHLTRGRVSRQSQRVTGWMAPFFQFSDI